MMNNFEKSCALIECYEQLENALNEITEDDLKAVEGFVKDA